jgi:hypothetical protein
MRSGTFLITLALSCTLWGQELNCRVMINHQQIQISDATVFSKMEEDFTRFLNERKWTNVEFAPEERIKCNLLVTITAMPAIGTFEASAQVISARPIYGTDYESVLLNFGDRDWSFSYLTTKPIMFNENTYMDNISSMLAFYAYVIIGMDFDSFGELAGDPYYQKAFLVVNNAQQSNYPGWQQFGSTRNRYWLIENLQNPSLTPIRTALYNYHRLGMDIMREQPDEAKNVIVKSLEDVQKANRARPRSILTISFMDAKAAELTNIFATGSPTVRRKAYNILTTIDPSKADKFKAMIDSSQ